MALSSEVGNHAQSSYYAVDDPIFFAMATSYSCVVGKGHPKFDKASVQAGVDADAISYEDYLNSKGETVVRKLSTPGVYSVYCDPHAGAGMKMTITVQ